MILVRDNMDIWMTGDGDADTLVDMAEPQELHEDIMIVSNA